MAYGLFAQHSQTDYWRHIYKRFPALFELARGRMAAERGPAAVAELNHAKWSRIDAEVGTELIRQHKAAYLVTAVSGVIGTYLDGMWETGIETLGFDLYFWKPSLIVASAAGVLTVVAGIVVLWRSERALCVLTILTLSYLTILSSGPASDARLGIPIAPVYAIPLAIGLDGARRRLANPIFRYLRFRLARARSEG